MVTGQSIELHGIDAPEYEQNCLVDLEVWLCGIKASQALENFVGASTVTCQGDGICFVRGRNLAAWMVLNDWALAAADYEDQERRTRIAELGLWRGDFVTPWEWRQGKRLAPPPPLPAGCLIKGDIAKSGEHTFHMPGGRDYENTLINTETGERWFCTEAEAMAAGWSKSRR